MKKILSLLLIFPLTLISLSCSQGKFDPFDEQAGLSISNLKDGVMKNVKEEKKLAKSEKEKSEAPIPNASKLIMAPPPPAIGGEKTVSFSVTDQVPLKDVLIELGRMAQIDIDLDPNISGGIILNAKNRPLKEIIDRITNLGNLRYSYQNGVLHFEKDTPFIKNYFVDYLSGGSLWTDVETNIAAILKTGTSSSSTSSSSTSDNSDKNSSSDKTSSDKNSSKTEITSSFTSNKSAGIISIYATEKQHASVTKYLSDVEKSASAQVLIEAKVVEVKLTDVYKTGVDWTLLGKNGTLTTANGYTAGGPLGYVATGVMNSDLNTSISALETFGSTRTLSSPRLHAINNQKATLNFADKLVYFTVVQSQSSSSNGSSTSIVATTKTSTKNEEKVGVQLDITPSINLRTNEITMNIRPQLSVRSEWVVDPASPTDNNGKVTVENKVPVIQTRDLTTIAKIQSGNVFVIGGLMKESTSDTDSGVPFLGRIPIIGWFFKSVSKDSAITETVIFIKATIVKSGSPADKIDRDMQNKFDTNRRKFF
jgi:MSHA biogenesis protein MshL